MIVTHNMLEKAGISVIGEYYGRMPGVSIDTRTLKQGELFWALTGDNTDGHFYVRSAFAMGASIAAVSREWFDIQGEWKNEHLWFVMDNPLQGMQTLARVIIENTGAMVVGLTGSYGKTTTRRLIAAGLATDGVTVETEGNRNNHIGLPLTLLNLPGEEKYIVLEMGANHPGEIDFLCKIAKPAIGVITVIRNVHTEGFGDLEGVQKAKGELFRYLEHEGMAIVNLNDNRVRAEAEKNKRKAGYFLGNIPSDWNYSYYGGHILGIDAWSRPVIAVEGMQVGLKMPGKQHALSAIAAYAVCVEAGAEPERILPAIARVEPVEGRGNVLTLADNIELLDESYNAGPASIMATLETLSARPGEKIAVLGDMYELGTIEEEEHRRIGHSILLDEIDRVIFVGERMIWAFEEAELSGHPGVEYLPEADPEQLAERITSGIAPGTGIAIKGSHAMRLDRTVARLVELLAPNEETSGEEG